MSVIEEILRISSNGCDDDVLMDYIQKNLDALESELNGDVYDQNFFWGEGVVDGEGGSSERCLKWGGGGGGSLRDLSKNILK